MDLLVVIQVSGQRIQLAAPELLVAREPRGGGLHGFGRQRAADDAAVLGAGDQPGVFQHPQVLQEGGQRHGVGPGQVADGCRAVFQIGQYPPPGGVGQGGKDAVQRVVV